MAEPKKRPVKPPGLELMKVSIPLRRVQVPPSQTEVQGIPDLYYQELKAEKKEEERKRAETKKAKLGKSRRQLTVDDYYTSTPIDESVAKAVGIKTPSGIIVTSTKANVEAMVRDKGERLVVQVGAEKQLEDPYRSADLFKGRIPKKAPETIVKAVWPPQVGPSELTKD